MILLVLGSGIKCEAVIHHPDAFFQLKNDFSLFLVEHLTRMYILLLLCVICLKDA